MAAESVMNQPVGDTLAVECIDLDVRDDEIIWCERTSDLAGKDNSLPTKTSHAKLALDPDCRDTIELLSSVLQLLVDVWPSGAEQRYMVEFTQMRLVNRLGEMLYRVLFRDPDLRTSLETAMARGRDGQLRLLRVELEFSGSSADLGSWPWEYLRTPEDRDRVGHGEFLAQSAALVLNRTLSFRYDKTFSTRRPELLLVVSRPRALGAVEDDKVQTEFKRMEGIGKIALHTLIEPPPSDPEDLRRRPTATWDAFLNAIDRYKPNIIHFIGQRATVL